MKPKVINSSKPLTAGSDLGNEVVKKALTSDGSSINDWVKMTTKTFKSPSGNFQIHFYENIKTGEISTFEMKAKFTK